MWIDIFKNGIQTDSRGFAHDGDKLIDMAIENFSADGDTVPVVVGHSGKDDRPAFGWVASLKKEDGKLWAKIRDLNPDFKKLIEQKTYPNRSAGFNNGKLGHIAFLGGQPPAVKGLEPVKFSEREKNAYFEIEFSEPEPAVEADPEPEEKKTEKETGMTEKELQEKLAAAKAEGMEAGKQAAREAAQAEFAAQQAAEKKAAQMEFARDADEAWLKQVSEGDDAFITPAQRSEFKEFLESIRGLESFEFSAGEGKIKKQPASFFREMMDKYMPKGASGEFATKSRAAGKPSEWDEIYNDACDVTGHGKDGK